MSHTYRRTRARRDMQAELSQVGQAKLSQVGVAHLQARAHASHRGVQAKLSQVKVTHAGTGKQGPWRSSYPTRFKRDGLKG